MAFEILHYTGEYTYVYMHVYDERINKKKENIKSVIFLGQKQRKHAYKPCQTKKKQLGDFHLQKCDKRYDTIRETGKAISKLPIYNFI